MLKLLRNFYFFALLWKMVVAPCPLPQDYIAQPILSNSFPKDSPVYKTIIVIMCKVGPPVLAICVNDQLIMNRRCAENMGKAATQQQQPQRKEMFPKYSISCPNPQRQIPNASVFCQELHCNAWQHQTVVDITCDPGFQLKSDTNFPPSKMFRSSCAVVVTSSGPSAFWSPPLPVCVPLRSSRLLTDPATEYNLFSQNSQLPGIHGNIKMLFGFMTISLFAVLLSLLFLLLSRYLKSRSENASRVGNASSRSTAAAPLVSSGSSSAQHSADAYRRFLLSSASRDREGALLSHCVSMEQHHQHPQECIPGLPSYEDVIKQIHASQQRVVSSAELIGAGAGDLSTPPPQYTEPLPPPPFTASPCIPPPPAPSSSPASPPLPSPPQAPILPGSSSL